MERLCLIGALGQQFERVSAISLGHPVTAGAHAVDEMFISPCGPLVAKQHSHVAQRSCLVGPQEFANGCQSELPSRRFPKYADPGEHPHHPIKRWGMGANLLRQRIDGNRRCAHVVCYPEPGDRGERICDLLAEQKLHYHRIRRQRR
jgi:hypothetical protein